MFSLSVVMSDPRFLVVLKQLHQAAEVALLRGARAISPEDIIFLMRKDKKKLRRLIRYMQFRDYKSRVLKTIEDEDVLDSAFYHLAVFLNDEAAHNERSRGVILYATVNQREPFSKMQTEALARICFEQPSLINITEK
ncbi:hypothetical protein cypCar_00027525 [Cyprinus carpio]|nr:hypothetical protein cypCar_00027525 [Cyprinus carpio]